MSPRRRIIAATAGAAMWPAFSACAQANTLRWVVPYPPGGGTDMLGRTLVETLRGPLRMSIVVENKPGASTNIAAQDVARAAPDGRTVLQADNALMAFNEHLFKKLPVDPDLASGLPIMQSGKVRVLAYDGKTRSPLLPGVPTLVEEELREVAVFAFPGLLGPAGLSPATVQRLNGELNPGEHG